MIIDFIKEYLLEHIDNFKNLNFEVNKAIFDSGNDNSFLVEVIDCNKYKKYVRISHTHFSEYITNKTLEGEHNE